MSIKYLRVRVARRRLSSGTRWPFRPHSGGTHLSAPNNIARRNFMRYLQTVFNTRKTPQMAPLVDRPEQVQNSAGGYLWPVDNWMRLERFLVLGSEGGTYYVTERKLILENAIAVREGLMTDGTGVVKLVEDRKSTRLNSSHVAISYAVFCLKKKKIKRRRTQIRPPKCVSID